MSPESFGVPEIQEVLTNTSSVMEAHKRDTGQPEKLSVVKARAI
jgi:hypothetical protein